MNHYCSAADSGGRPISGAAADDDLAAQHRFGQAPAGAFIDFDMRPIAKAGAIVPHASGEANAHRRKHSHTQIVARARIFHHDVGIAGSDGVLDFGVDLARSAAAADYLCHTRTSLTCASRTAYLPGSAARMAISSVATATKLSVSVMTSGFSANVSFTNPISRSVAARQL